MEAATAQAALPRSRRRDPRRLPDARARGRGPAASPTSTTPRRRRSRTAVIEAIDSYYRNSNANVHRSMHELAAEASELYEGGRAQGRRAGRRAPRARSCSCATRPRRSTSCASRGRASTWAPGDVVLITRDGAPLERGAVAAAVRGARRAARVRRDRRRGPARPRRARRAAGAGQREAGRADARLERARHDQPGRRDRASGRTRPGATVLVDGAQAVPQLPVDVAATGADFYAFTGHKMLGPTGIGVLWGTARAARGDAAVPGRRLDDQARSRTTTRPGPPLPAKFEAGTPGDRRGAPGWARRSTT